MSHELRTPLNSVIGFANVLRRGGARTLPESLLLYLDRSTPTRRACARSC